MSSNPGWDHPQPCCEHRGRAAVRWGSAEPRVLLIGHLDTVWPIGTLDRLPWRVEGDRVRGPGVFDMKAGIIQGIAALAALGCPDGVGMLLTSDEEIGSGTSRDLIEASAARAQAVFVLEPSVEGELKSSRKGTSWYEVEIIGRAAHAGLEPEKGINALVEAAAPRHRRHNVGRSRTRHDRHADDGASRVTDNTVPDRAVVGIDARAWSHDEQVRVDDLIRGWQPIHPQAQLSVIAGGSIDQRWPRQSTCWIWPLPQRLRSDWAIPVIEPSVVAATAISPRRSDADPRWAGCGRRRCACRSRMGQRRGNARACRPARHPDRLVLAEEPTSMTDGPLIVQSDKTLLLDVDHPRAIDARRAIAPFAEFERAPEHIHTYRITPLALWNARAAGHDAEQVVDMLDHLLALPGSPCAAGRYRRDDGPLWPTAPSPSTPCTGSFSSPPMCPCSKRCCATRRSRRWSAIGSMHDTVIVHPSERGHLKQVLLKLGWPAEDHAGYVDGEAHPIVACARTAGTCATTSAMLSKVSSAVDRGSWCCPAGPAKPSSAPRRWPGCNPPRSSS